MAAPEHCPHENDCEHGDKLKVRQDGTCADCGTQLTEVAGHVPVVRPQGARMRRARNGHEYDPTRPRDTTPDLYELLVKRTATP